MREVENRFASGTTGEYWEGRESRGKHAIGKKAKTEFKRSDNIQSKHQRLAQQRLLCLCLYPRSEP